MQKSFMFFETRIDTLSRHEFFNEVDDVLGIHNECNKPIKGNSHHIVTLNPEILLHARSNTRYRDIINASSRTVCDGFGMHLIFWKMRQRMHARITGVEITQYLLNTASRHKLSLVCICAEEGLTHFEMLRTALLKKYPDLSVYGFTIPRQQSISDLSTEQIALLRQAQVVVCNFGAPYQEHFLATIRETYPHIRAVYIGVGGAFDFLSGAQKRAPLWMQKHGLEWLWRLIMQPQRIGRILHATIIFPWHVYRWKQDSSQNKIGS